MEELLDISRAWVKECAGGSAEHLLRAEAWLRRLHPDASQAIRLATLTHDMERAFPGPDSPRQDPARGPDDPVYLQAHQERSARIVSDFLQAHQAPRALVEEVARLIRVHEVGGWPEADWVQAADSLSFLEVNIDPFLKMIDSPEGGWTLETVRAKFAWMFTRIQDPQAQVWARPLYEAAIEHLHQKEEAMGRPGHQAEP